MSDEHQSWIRQPGEPLPRTAQPAAAGRARAGAAPALQPQAPTPAGAAARAHAKPQTGPHAQGQPPVRARGVRQLQALALLALLAFLLLLATGHVHAQPAAAAGAVAPGGLPLMVAQGAGGTSYSVPIQTLLFFTALGFLPAVLLLMTAFTRIVIVLGLLRQAMGTQAAPPNQVILGLSLFLTFFVMTPTLDKIYDTAWAPYSAGTLPMDRALAEGAKPLREFMLKQTRQSDVQLFAKLARLPADVKGADVPLTVLVPAFVTSELKSAFQIGFMIFIPFLIIDMIVASVLMSLGMMMLSPVLVALPFKLMLFVLADGWNLLLGSLAASFVT